ncbi:hypothetical protein DFA_00893 [Cavenderia fasciculata]|uniref:Uncharacterized protein n=1 Tax=Cavenderia fasciculata TaxID=261658 RepID=F4PUF2_CACFS|nr:uncharacterized protein DFA_00893 [Cavenderia fasciculata]EGG21024.1 hypothetical protein DFA_00893 [Cavenderia fasciculata]|eukprot:XP_004358874.1 hypothetical protein DFA_00893 [Cavenderia fasciculata]
MNCSKIDYGTVKLPSSLIELALVKYQDAMPVGFIPNSVKKLTIKSSHDPRTIEILPLSIPSSVEILSLPLYNGPTTSEYLPDSIKELVWNRETDTQTLPSKLETLLDQVINQTNIEKLSISRYGKRWLKATIKRLDKDNSRVLIVDNKSLIGGIISQSRDPSNNNSNEYTPIYLHIRKENNYLPYWSH